MGEFVIWLFLILGFIALVWVCFLILRLFWRLFFPPRSRVVTHQVTITRTPDGNGGSDMTAEEEGNVHSGPYGYSPNTAYPQTQYGSLFDPDAEWKPKES